MVSCRGVAVVFVVAFGFFDLLSLGPLIMRYIGVVRVTLNFLLRTVVYWHREIFLGWG